MTEYTFQKPSLLPTVVKHLLIINCIVFFAEWVLESRGYYAITNLCALNALWTGDFHAWQLLTYMFMHAGIDHLLLNMFALWMFGSVLENYWGWKRFLLYYLICGIGAGLINLLIPGWGLTVGASGAIYGLLLAFGMTFPNEYIYFYFLVPIKAKWFVIIFAVIELLEGFFSTGNVAHFAHLGGMVFGLLLILLWRRRH